MLKLWVVLYVAGSVQGTWGPLPYGLAECWDRTAVMMLDLRERSAKHGVDVSEWRLACEYHGVRPALEAE